MSTLHPASLQHTDRDIKYRGERAQGALGAWREQGVRPDSPPAPGPPLPSGSVRDVADRQMRSLRHHEGRARGPGPLHSCPDTVPHAGLSDTGKSVLEHGLPQVQRLAPRGTGREGFTKRRPGLCPPPPRTPTAVAWNRTRFLKERNSDFPAAEACRAARRTASDACTEQRQ